MKRFRYLSSVFAVAVLLMTAANSGASAARAHTASSVVTVNFLYRGTSPSQDQWVKWLVAKFNQQNQGKINVVVSSIPDADFHQKINLVLRASNAPDVFFSWEGGWAKYMIDSGYSEPLDRYYKKYHWSEELSPVADKLANIEGHKYFVAAYMSSSVVWYNTAIFKKYGLVPPKTFDQLTAIANTLKSHGIAPFLLANQQQWEAQFDWTGYFVNKNGLAAYNALLTRHMSWTDPRVVDAFAQMKRMEDNGWFLKGINSMDFDTTAIIFWKRQQAAMWYQGSFILDKFISNKKLQYPVDWFPYPQIGNQAPTQSVFAEDTYMMNKHSMVKDTAAQFLNFLISADVQRQQMDLKGPFAANSSVQPAGMAPMVQRLGQTMAKYKEATFMHIDHALGPEVAQPFLEQLQGVLAGTTTPAKAAAVTEAAAKKSMGPVHM